MKSKLIEVIVRFPFTDDFDKIELEINKTVKYASITGAGCGFGTRDISYELPTKKLDQFNKDVLKVLTKYFKTKNISIYELENDD